MESREKSLMRGSLVNFVALTQSSAKAAARLYFQPVPWALRLSRLLRKQTLPQESDRYEKRLEDIEARMQEIQELVMVMARTLAPLTESVENVILSRRQERLDLRGVKLDSAAIRGKKLHATNLSDASLVGADLSGTDLSGADLQGANLEFGLLVSTDLSESNLTGANLRRATLINANLRGARLVDANLRLADLRDADLTRCVLENADLREADLRGADFSMAYMIGAIVNQDQLNGAKSIEGAEISPQLKLD